MEKKDFIQLHNEFKIIEKKIRQYDVIIIYRHQSPDLDALGCQCSLYTWIKDNYPLKEVFFVGDTNNNLIPLIFPMPMEESSLPVKKEHLAITLDVSDYKRIASNHINLAKEVIKIDHHPLPEKKDDLFGNYLCIHPEFASACELLSLFFLSRSSKYKISSKCAEYLYAGIVGDTNRFLYPATSISTFNICASLLSYNFDKDELYNKIYQIDKRRLNILKYCLNNYQITSKGTVYVIFEKEDLKRLNMETYEGNNYLNELRNLIEANIILSITYIESKKNYRVSFRSKNIPINILASKYNGGGHKFASGGSIDSIKSLPKLLKDCDETITFFNKQQGKTSH